MERNGIDTDSVFKMDVDQSIDEKNRILHPVGCNLDVSMDKLFNYIIMECHDTDTGTVHWDKTKRNILYLTYVNLNMTLYIL